MKKLIALLLCFVALCAVPAFAMVPKNTPKPTATTEPEEATLQTDEASFQIFYMYVMDKLNQSYDYDVIDRTEGKKYEYVTVTLSPYCTGMITVKNSEIVDILIVGSGDGTKASGSGIMSTLIATVMSVDASVSLSDATEIVLNLISTQGTYSSKCCTYELSISDSIGTMFTVKPLEE